MLVTVVKGHSKSCWCREGWVIRRARRKLKDGKVVCHVGRRILNRTFRYAADAISHCVTKLNIPEYRIVFGEDVYQDIENQKQKALDIVLREQRIKELADQFLPPTPDLNSLRHIFPGVLEQTLNQTLSRINREESFYRRATGVALYKLEEDIKRFTEEK